MGRVIGDNRAGEAGKGLVDKVEGHNRVMYGSGRNNTIEAGGKMLEGFKQFILRGNVLDLAVAVVMGAAFGAVVTALVKDLITPFIAAIVAKPDFAAIAFTVNGSKFPVGDFINALVSFILIGAAVYFFIVLPVNALLARMRRGEVAPDPTTKKCPECLSDVPIAARRCAFCTSPFGEATPHVDPAAPDRPLISGAPPAG